MKSDWHIPLIIIVGIAVLFFFPEPQTNFVLYLLTALSFALLTIYLIIKRKK